MILDKESSKHLLFDHIKSLGGEKGWKQAYTIKM